MTTEQQGEWGAPQQPPPPRPRWTMRRTIIAVAVAVGIAAAGGIAIYAASGTVAADAGQRGGPGGPVIIGPGGGPGGGSPQGGFDETQHGEFQVGEVTELTDTEITAKSADGFTKTYAIDADTVISDDVKKGDSVTIVARTSGDTTTATAVTERESGDQPPPQKRN